MSRHDKEMQAYRNANPWIVYNVSINGQNCGRYPTREAAEKKYAGKVVEVNETTKTVYVTTPVYC